MARKLRAGQKSIRDVFHLPLNRREGVGAIGRDGAGAWADIGL